MDKKMAKGSGRYIYILVIMTAITGWVGTAIHNYENPKPLEQIKSNTQILADREFDSLTLPYLSDAHIHKTYFTVTSISFSPDDKYGLLQTQPDVQMKQNMLQIWDIANGECIKVFGDKLYLSPVFSPDGKNIVTTDLDGVITAWDVKSGDAIRTIKVPEKKVFALAYNNDGMYILSGALQKGNALKLWDMHTGAFVRTFKDANYILSIAYSADGKYAVTGSLDSAITLWDVTTGTSVHKFVGHKGKVVSVAISPDGGHIVSGANDSTMKLWDVKTGKCIRTYPGRNDYTNVTFSTDGNFVLSAFFYSNLALYDIRNDTNSYPYHTFLGHYSPNKYIDAVAISHDGKHILSASSDSTMRIWDTGL